MCNFECNNLKSQVCVESKYDEHSYKSVERNYNPLELIYTDICNMNSTSSCGGKKYPVTFINNCIRNGNVYLLNGKVEVIKMSRKYNIELENQLGKR